MFMVQTALLSKPASRKALHGVVAWIMRMDEGAA